MTGSERVEEVAVRDIARGLWLRRWPLLAVAAVLFVAGAVLVAALPAEYRARVVVVAGAQRPSSELILPSVSLQPEDRLKALHGEMLSDALLRELATDTGAYGRDSDMETRVAKLRSHLDLALEGDAAFTLTATAAEPALAASLANRLPELYAERLRAERLAEATRAKDVFEPALKALRQKLAQQDGAVTRFKAAAAGRLPEQLEGNLRGLDRLSLLQERDVEALIDAQRRHAALLEAGRDDGTALGRLRRHQEELTTSLTEARSQWTGVHPEVRRLKRDLDLTGVQVRALETQQGESGHELHAVAKEIDRLKRDEGDLGRSEGELKQRVEATPAIADQLGRLTRERDATQTKYVALLGRQVEADLALELETKQGPSLLRVLAQATAPQRPARPDRQTGLMLALLLAIAAALALGVGLEMADDSLRGPDDVQLRLGVPVLAIVPSFAETQGSAVRLVEQR